MREERLPVGGELDAARGPAEQPYAEVLLQRGDAPGDGLLGKVELIGRRLELPPVGGDDEGTHGSEVHAPDPRSRRAPAPPASSPTTGSCCWPRGLLLVEPADVTLGSSGHSAYGEELRGAAVAGAAI